MKVLRSEIERLPIAKCNPAEEREISLLAKKILDSDDPSVYMAKINAKIAALYNLTIDELDIITKNK
jgi:hypothetical protein